MAPITLVWLAALATLFHNGHGSPRNLLDNQIIAALENLRNHMVEGWPEMGIPPLDPLHLGHVDVDSNGTSIHGNLTNMAINQLSTFNIDRVHTSVLGLSVEVSLGLPLLDVNGSYSIHGSAGILPIYGSGPFWLDAYNMTLSVYIKLGQTEVGLGVKALDITIDNNTTDVHFDGILGGGEMGELVNGILSSLAPDLLQALEDRLVPWLEEALTHEINNILHPGVLFSVKATRDESVNDFFDLLFANMRQSIIENGLDPIPLPEDRDNFTVTLFNSTVSGEVRAGEGVLAGLSTIHRADDMTILYVGDEDEVIWGGEVGLIDLEVDYKLGLELAVFGKELDLNLKMSYVHLSFETDVFIHQANITFARCNITELGPLHYHQKGAGPLDTPLYNTVANTLLQELTGLVASAVQGVVCTLLEQAFGA